MSELFIVDTVLSNRLNIKNPTIISFYNKNTHIDFESVNLLVIEILQKSGSGAVSIKTIDDFIHQDDHKSKELDTFLTNIREGIRKLIQSISSKYIIAKSEYIREFKSASFEKDPRELIFKANKTFYDNACSLLSANFHLRIFNIAEKTKIILHQFNKILTANADQIFTKIDFQIKVDEYSKFRVQFRAYDAGNCAIVIGLLNILRVAYKARLGFYKNTRGSVIYHLLQTHI